MLSRQDEKKIRSFPYKIGLGEMQIHVEEFKSLGHDTASLG